MAYIKISDPKIIDLPTIHQIINVVNQHSDNISAISNNFGGIYNSNLSSGSTVEHAFDFSSQQIMYGQTAITGGASGIALSSGIYTATVPLLGQTFSTTPIVIANYSVTSGSPALYSEIIVNTTNISTDSFKISLHRVGHTDAWLSTNTVNVNWVALGSK
jgi:hypothetical protein